MIITEHLPKQHQTFFWFAVEDINISDIFYKIKNLDLWTVFPFLRWILKAFSPFEIYNTHLSYNYIALLKGGLTPNLSFRCYEMKNTKGFLVPALCQIYITHLSSFQIQGEWRSPWRQVLDLSWIDWRINLPSDPITHIQYLDCFSHIMLHSILDQSCELQFATALFLWKFSVRFGIEIIKISKESLSI